MIPIGKFINTLSMISNWNRGDADHGVRTAEIAWKIGTAYGLDFHELRDLDTVCRIHDIGKLGVNDSVLYKPGPLNHAERVQLEKHPQIGYSMLLQSGLSINILLAVLYHHEKWNGTGYPSHLSGESIPVLSRVASISDVWDALNSERPYRKAFRRPQPRELMEQQKDQFDPKAYDAFDKLYREDKI